MMTIYIHRKKVLDILCMLYALGFPYLLDVCDTMRGATFQIRWAYAALALTALYFLALYIFSQICDWKMAAVNLAVFVAAIVIRNGFDSFFYFLVDSDFAAVLFMIFILCHRGYEAKRKADSSSPTATE